MDSSSSSSSNYYDTSDTETSSSNSSEEPVVLKRTIRSRNNPLEYYNDIEFKSRFRFGKATFMDILNLIHPNLSNHVDNRGLPLNNEMKLMIALRFYATASFQVVIGDHTNVHKSTVCRTINEVSRTLASLAPQHIHMPTVAEMNHVKYQFHKLANFPMVCGAIDCTHIKIQSAGGANAELFRNRKGYFSINVQVVCDAELKIRNIVARWQGSVHDSTIFNASRLRAQFESGEFPNTILLGDSAYPCRRYLLTPIRAPQNAAEDRYNRAHIRTRNVVERCFGVWKRRFPCLMYGLRTKLSTTLKIIVATAVLHNIAKQADAIEEEEPFMNEEIDMPANRGVQQNTAMRNAIISETFH